MTIRLTSNAVIIIIQGDWFLMPVRGSFANAFGWCMAVQVWYALIAYQFIAISYKVWPTTSMAGSNVVLNIDLFISNVVDFMA